jgi:hypothetical protein
MQLDKLVLVLDSVMVLLLGLVVLLDSLKVLVQLKVGKVLVMDLLILDLQHVSFVLKVLIQEYKWLLLQ